MSAPFTHRGFVLPADVVEDLAAYIKHRRHVGGFLRAVLENDLMAACGRGDDASLAALPACVAFLYNNAPAACFGSPGKVQAWLAGGSA